MSESSSVFQFALNIPVFHCFDYRVDADMNPQPGKRFVLPFGSKQKLGIVVGVSEQIDTDESKIKQALESLDDKPVLSNHLLQLAQWMAEYYCQPVGEVIFQLLPRYCRQSQALKSTCLQVWSSVESNHVVLDVLKKKAPRQFELYQAIRLSEQGLNASQLRQLHESWSSTIKKLESKELVKSHWQENLPSPSENPDPGPALTLEQQEVVNGIRSKLSSFKVHLLQGVTGSGKTEVYLDIMQQQIQQGRQVIYLVPEIGLTPQLLSRLQARLGAAVVSSHSAQTDFQRYQSWDQFRRGVASVLLGTRSALFSQAKNLGLIVIDEEHDASYRQQDGVRYHARDVAIKRAQMLDIPVISGSATPSTETLFNLEKSHYQLHQLTQRPLAFAPPEIELIDTRQRVLNTGCSEPLLKAMDQHLENNGQVLLYLNRRGFAPVVMCHGCGWQANCFQCDSKMTMHLSSNQLICHHCGFRQMVPQKCPECGESEIHHYGVGTQQLETFLSQRFESVDVIRIDRDSVSNADQFERKLKPVREGKPCILVGTQMLAKGHDYPNITLVGILDADQALFSSFYRASERLIQTVLQVSGRAGRAGSKGQALLQTAFADHELMQGLTKQDYSSLITPILQERKLLGFPPYNRVVTFQVDALTLQQATERLDQIKGWVNEMGLDQGIKLIGPIPALMTRRIGRFRAQLSLLSVDYQRLRSLLKRMMPRIAGVKNSQKSRLTIEVDPLDL